ncbi:MAG: class I SAM-dependent methyltransferase [Firmicutes bacterium]|nr:class I SAM-dependent methyltransferase [Bacillota bacterium]
MNSYTDFARVYDALMRDDIDYEAWADYIEAIFKRYGACPQKIYDLACGTGNITLPLSRRGYDMTGIDISEDMLNIAAEKGSGAVFVKQNIADLRVPSAADAVTCMIDGVNYIISPKALYGAFKRIKTAALDDGGIFIFDISTEFKLKTVIGENTFIHSDEDIFYSWQNHYIENRNMSDMFLTFFVRQGESYSRFEERHLQRAYSEDEIRFLLDKAGFNSVDAYEELTFEKPKEQTQRIVFVCR